MEASQSVRAISTRAPLATERGRGAEAASTTGSPAALPGQVTPAGPGLFRLLTPEGNLIFARAARFYADERGQLRTLDGNLLLGGEEAPAEAPAPSAAPALGERATAEETLPSVAARGAEVPRWAGAGLETALEVSQLRSDAGFRAWAAEIIGARVTASALRRAYGLA